MPVIFVPLGLCFVSHCVVANLKDLLDVVQKKMEPQQQLLLTMHLPLV